MNYWKWHGHCHCSFLIAHPVGDGNAIELQNWGTALMDCGGNNRALHVLKSASARGMSEFLLTHLHADHYSGVTKQPAGTKLASDVNHVYLPALPLIANRSLTAGFAQALFTMNALLGTKSGVPEQDLIDTLRSLNPSDSTPSHTLLSKGDDFCLAGTPFEVLWPPRVVSDRFTRAARKAVQEFEQAIEQNEKAKEIFNRLKEQATHAALRAEDRAGSDAQREANDFVSDEGENHQEDATGVENDNEIDQEVPENLRRANKAIRRVANRLCLAFRSGSRLIHLGDLENAELDHVVTDLGRATDFFGMVAAHHGTHFSCQMKKLQALHLIVSNGTRWPKLKSDYREIANYIQETNVHGHSFLMF